jgi:hypothetical protein
MIKWREFRSGTEEKTVFAGDTRTEEPFTVTLAESVRIVICEVCRGPL